MHHARFRIAAAAALLLLFAPLHNATASEDPGANDAATDQSVEPRADDDAPEDEAESDDPDERADTDRPAMPIPIPGSDSPKRRWTLEPRTATIRFLRNDRLPRPCGPSGTERPAHHG